MLRIIALLLVGYLIWLWLRPRRSVDAPPPSEQQALPLLRCAQCGTFVPETEVVRDGERTFCCADHRTKFREHLE